jgi:aminoglycoside/choline kinase family phosphotransferase
MAKVRFPIAPDQMTPEWLTFVLRQSGAIGDAAVESLETEVIGAGVGLLGQLLRVRPRYDRAESGAPHSLVVKMPSAVQENRDLAGLFRFYEREVRFYEQIADKIELRTPRCYHSQFDPETGTFVLVLEDMAPARVCDQVAGATAIEAETAIRGAAKLHAPWWASPQLDRLDWMPVINDPVHKSAEESYQKSWEPFLQKFGQRLSRYVLDTGYRLATNICRLQDLMADPPYTIVHGDYRYDNMFFDTNERGLQIRVVDWQITSKGRGAYDIGYFMSQSVDPDERRAREEDLLRMYHRLLVEGGVADYSFDDLLLDYKRAVLFCWVYPVISGGTLDLSNERGVTLVATLAERSAAAIEDLKAGDLLD